MKVIIFWLLFFGGMTAVLLGYMTAMPGELHTGALVPLTEEEQSCSDRIQATVEMLSKDIGSRGNESPSNLLEAEGYLQGLLHHAGCTVRTIDFDGRTGTTHHLEVEFKGQIKADEIVVIAAHYDTAVHVPGADTDASGCAAVVELARTFAEVPVERTLRFVLFSGCSPPRAGGDQSGSAAYAREARKKGEKIVAAICIDSIGYYKDAPGTESVPFPFNTLYPDAANFVAFVSDFNSRDLLRTCIQTFRFGTRFPCEGISVPGFTPGASESDQAPFWKQDYAALLVTDTGSLRSTTTGTPSDTPDRLDYQRMARVVQGLTNVITGLTKRQTLL